MPPTPRRSARRYGGRPCVLCVSHQRRHHPCSSYAPRRNLTLLSPDLLRRCRKCRRPIAAAPGQQCPSNARHLVGNRHRHDPERLAFKSGVTHGSFSGWWRARFNTAWAPTTECVSDIGRLVSRSARASVCRQSNLAAVRSRSSCEVTPDRKIFGSGTVAAMAVAPTMPIQGCS